MLTRELHNPLHQTKLFHHPKITTRETPYLSLHIFNSRCPFCRTEYCWVSHFWWSIRTRTTSPFYILLLLRCSLTSNRRRIELKINLMNQSGSMHTTHTYIRFSSTCCYLFSWDVGPGLGRIGSSNTIRWISVPLLVVISSHWSFSRYATVVHYSINHTTQHTMLLTHYKTQIPARQTR